MIIFLYVNSKIIKIIRSLQYLNSLDSGSQFTKLMMSLFFALPLTVGKTSEILAMFFSS